MPFWFKKVVKTSILFRVIDDGQEEPTFEVVIDDTEFESVAKVYEEIMSQED